MSSFPEIFGYDELSYRERKHYLGSEFDREKRIALEERYQENIQTELLRFNETQQKLIKRYRTEHARIVEQLTTDRNNLVLNHIRHLEGDTELEWKTGTAGELKKLQSQAVESYGTIQEEILTELEQSRDHH